MAARKKTTTTKRTTKKATSRKTGGKKKAGAKKGTGKLNAAVKVLEQAKVPLDCKTMVERMAKNGY